MSLGRVAKNTFVVAAFFGVNKALALVYTILVARRFGLSPEMDAFNAANNIPDMLFALISGGALAMAFIPVLSEVLTTEGREAMWGLFSRVANLVFLVTASLAFAVARRAWFLVTEVVAPGFDLELQVLTVELMRLNLIALMLFSLSGLVSAGLYAHQHFWLPAMAPVMLDIGQLIGVLLLAPRWGVHGLVYGNILGAALHLGIQVPGLWKYRFRWLPRIELLHPRVLQVLFLMGPRVLTIFFIQLIFIARDFLASYLPPGSITALAYGWYIMQVPETLLGTAVGLVLLPTFSELWARRDLEGFRRTVNQGIRIVLALNLTAAAVLAAALPYLLPVLGLNFQDTQLVVWTARAYLAGMAGHALLELVARGFYAQQDAITPLFASFFNTFLYLALAFFFGKRLGAVGIGLANAMAFTTEALLLTFFLARRHPGIVGLHGTWWRTLAGMALGAGAVYALSLVRPEAGLVEGFLRAALGAGLALAWIWPEVRTFLRMNPLESLG